MGIKACQINITVVLYITITMKQSLTKHTCTDVMDRLLVGWGIVKRLVVGVEQLLVG